MFNKYILGFLVSDMFVREFGDLLRIKIWFFVKSVYIKLKRYITKEWF